MHKKFEDIIPLEDGWEILSEDGFDPLRVVCKIAPENIWLVRTEHCEMQCSDNHILFSGEGFGVYVSELQVGDCVLTVYGKEKVIEVCPLPLDPVNMYDVMVDSETHTYIANGLLCHNTTIVVVNLVHFILFNSDKPCAILANKGAQAQEIMSRLQLAYTNLPKWLQVGVLTWNKRSIELENGSSIIAAATSSDSVRGKSFAYAFLDECVSGDTEVTIRDKEMDEVLSLTMKELWERCNGGSSRIVTCTRYQILTKKGFKNFTGMKKTDGPHRIIKFDDGKHLDCALTHRLIDSDESEIYAIDIYIGQKIDGRVVTEYCDLFSSCELYDALNVEDGSTYLTNGINSHNCAFIPKNMWNSFFTSTWPTISSGQDSKMTIVSCVTKDTYVYTDRGIERIGNYIDSFPVGAHVVPTYHILGKSKLRDGHIVVNSGRTRTKIIKTKYTELECSENHKLYVCRDGVYGWVKSLEICSGDYVALQIGMNQWGSTICVNNVMLSEPLMFILGLYVSTGTIERNRVVISCDEDISSIFKKAGMDYQKEGNRYYSVELADVVQKIGFPLKNESENNYIPESLLQVGRNEIISMVCGIFSVCNASCKKRMMYRTLSDVLVKQLRMILMNLGILTRKITYKREGKILNLLLFSETSTRMYSDMEKSLKGENSYHSFEMVCNDTGIIPYCGDFIRRHGLQKKFKLRKGNQHVSRKKMLHCADVTDNISWKEFFDRNVSENIFWDEVKLVENSENEVFDVSLENGDDYFSHSVIYNGIVGHQTPNGRNHFYDLWINAKDGRSKFIASEVNWWEVPGRDEKWREEQLMVMSEEQFNVEYGNSFDATSNTLISPYKFKQLGENVHAPIQTNGKMRIYNLPENTHNYFATVDCADGGGDYSTISIIDVTTYPYHQVAVYSDNEISHINLPAIIKSMCERYNNAYVLVESNEIGTTILHILNYDLEYENIVKTLRSSLGTMVLGQKTTKKTKQSGCVYLKDMVEKFGLIIQDEATVDELRHFNRNGDSYAAERGYHDDLVMGLVNFAYYSTTPQFRLLYDTNFTDNFREKYEQEVMENLTPMPLFGNKVLSVKDDENTSWLN